MSYLLVLIKNHSFEISFVIFKQDDSSYVGISTQESILLVPRIIAVEYGKEQGETELTVEKLIDHHMSIENILQQETKLRVQFKILFIGEHTLTDESSGVVLQIWSSSLLFIASHVMHRWDRLSTAQ